METFSLSNNLIFPLLCVCCDLCLCEIFLSLSGSVNSLWKKRYSLYNRDERYFTVRDEKYYAVNQYERFVLSFLLHFSSVVVLLVVYK